jgi:TPR repeat protein
VQSLTKLGIANLLGEGVPLDPVRAYMWLALAARSGDTAGESSLLQLEQELSQEQLAEARGLAIQWRARHGGAARS